jgi:Type IV secretion-system coupling protein DNA-binding domain
MLQILRQIKHRGDSAIVYDPAREFVKRSYDPKNGDVILNPLDKRCPYWGPSEELPCYWVRLSPLQRSGGSDTTFGDGDWRSQSSLHMVLGDVANCSRGDWLRGGAGRNNRRCTIAVPFAAKGQSYVCLKPLSKEFKNDITDERGDHGNFKIGLPSHRKGFLGVTSSLLSTHLLSQSLPEPRGVSTV